MNHKIEKVIGDCTACREELPSQQYEPFVEGRAVDIMSPMSDLSADLASHNGKDYLIIVDRYSGFPWVKKKCQGTDKVIDKITEGISEHGKPICLRTDGGPCFTSQAYEDWTDKKNITRELSSVDNPRSNGLA